MAERSGKSNPPRLVRYRAWVQTAFLGVWMLPLGGSLFNICGPVFHCYACPLATFACPIGVIANFSALHLFPFFAVGTLLVIGGAVGAFICGWVCPFGFFQDLLGKVPTPRWKLPAWTGHMRWAVLVGLVIVVPYFFGEGHLLFICRVCPVGGIEGAGPEVVGAALAGHEVLPWPSLWKIGIVVLVVTAMFFTYRPWCILFCPLGVIFTAFNRFSAFFLRYKPNECTSCGACHKMCPIGLEPDKRANDPRCIRCLECTKCPTSALSVGNVFKKS